MYIITFIQYVVKNYVYACISREFFNIPASNFLAIL